MTVMEAEAYSLGQGGSWRLLTVSHSSLITSGGDLGWNSILGHVISVREMQWEPMDALEK